MTREIITSRLLASGKTVEPRRKWPDEEKLRIISEALVPGASTCAVADRNGVCRSLLYSWLRLAREGLLPGIALGAPKSRPATAAFVPVTVRSMAVPSVAAAPREAIRSANQHMACAPAPARRRVTSIEVVLVNGRTLKVDESIDPTVLAQLVAALEGVGT